MRYLIIDDEPIAHRIIEGYCQSLTYLEKVDNCYNAFEASKLLKTTQVDLLFLDINMPQLSGFEFLRTLTDPPHIIVTTAYEEFALEGYELNIVDYLLKPFSFERFLKAINKINLERRDPNFKVQTSNEYEQSSFFVKGDKTRHQVHFDSILFLEAYGNYTKIYIDDSIILGHHKISELEKLLPQKLFVRIHKSFIVSLKKITEIMGNRVHIGEHKIPIGQTYKAITRDLFR